MKAVFEKSTFKKAFCQKPEMTKSFTSLSWHINFYPKPHMKEDIKHTLLIDF